MMERVDYSTIPFPFDELPLADQPMTDLDFVTVMKPMLRASFALARVTYCAALTHDVSDEDVREALSVLAEYLECSLACFQRWEQRALPDRPTKGGGA
jgi:hypothetical protein